MKRNGKRDGGNTGNVCGLWFGVWGFGVLGFGVLYCCLYLKGVTCNENSRQYAHDGGGGAVLKDA